MLPPLSGRAVRVEMRQSLGAHAAATSIPGRLILLDSSVLATHGEFERILIHELFHFAWVRLSNQARWKWEDVLRRELRARVAGELGWSAEWRKVKLRGADARERTPAWRRYVCESFCDTSAWLYSGLAKHDEFTLPAKARRARRIWFETELQRTVLV